VVVLLLVIACGGLLRRWQQKQNQRCNPALSPKTGIASAATDIAAAKAGQRSPIMPAVWDLQQHHDSGAVVSQAMGASGKEQSQQLLLSIARSPISTTSQGSLGSTSTAATSSMIAMLGGAVASTDPLASATAAATARNVTCKTLPPLLQSTATDSLPSVAARDAPPNADNATAVEISGCSSLDADMPDERQILHLAISWSSLQLDSAPLGRGFFGEVYGGSWHGMRVAVKVLKGATGGEGGERAALRHQARIMSRVRHPGIATYYGLAEESGPGGKCGLVMQHYRRGALSSALGTLRWAEVGELTRLRMALQVGCVLA
jgi:hypothetical protein